MNKKRLNILGLSYSQTQTGAYALVLSEENGRRRIPIIIGGAEAQSIAIQIEGLKPLRPLTHDLFVSMATSFNITITEVSIFKLEEGIFYSELVCERGEETIRVDARTSDAIAIALRFRCPIYTTEDILSRAGIFIDFDDQSKDIPDSDINVSEVDLTKTDIERLEELLNEAVAEENYEQASIIRDEINTRKGEKND